MFLFRISIIVTEIPSEVFSVTRIGGVTDPRISINRKIKKYYYFLLDLDLNTISRYNTTSYHYYYKHYRERKKRWEIGLRNESSARFGGKIVDFYPEKKSSELSFTYSFVHCIKFVIFLRFFFLEVVWTFKHYRLYWWHH